MGKRFIEQGGEICAYNDESLDLYIELLGIIKNNTDWLFLEALTNFHDSFIFYDCNELTYMLYEYVKEKGIAYEIRSTKWDSVYGIKERQENWQNLRSPILISDETRRGETSAEKVYSNGCYAFLNTIYKVNIFLKAENLLDYKDFFQKLNLKGFLAQSLPIQLSWVNYLALIKILNDEKVPNLLRTVKRVTSKRIVGILCNCQGEIIFSMLKKQKNFMKDFFVILLPPLYYIKEKSIQCICKNIFSEFDVFIYQYVKNTFYQPFFATKNIVSFLKEGCRKICIPDLYFDGYYPQADHIDKPMNVLCSSLYGDAVFQIRDYYIEEVYSQTKSITETVEILSGKKNIFFDKKKIEQHWDMAVYRMLKKEEKADLKMSDYILENIKEKRLFTAAHNPVNELMYIVVKRLLEMLSVPFDQFDYNDNMPNFGDAEQVIYPYVKKVLELNFDVGEVYANKAFVDKKLKLEEYIELYIRNVCKID